MRLRSQDLCRSVDRGTRRPAIELRNQAVRGADAVVRSGRQYRDRRYGRAGHGPCAVADAVHAWKLLTREPRDPITARRRWCDGPAGEGHKPYVRHVRRWEVGRLHNTAEAPEQGRTANVCVRREVEAKKRWGWCALASEKLKMLGRNINGLG